MEASLLTRLKRFDASRPGFPGEHLFTLAAGVWLLARGGSFLRRAAGLALVARAVTGRDGLLRPGPLRQPSGDRHPATPDTPIADRRSTPATSDVVASAPLAV